jgi:ParB family chromosome partitioning protein
MKRKALGKGLGSLIPQSVDKDKKEKLVDLEISRINPSPYQPRRNFDKEKLEELAASIKSSGVIQPVVVASNGKGGYDLIAGERRWRAAGLAGLQKIPAVIRDLTEDKKAEYAIVENIQRENLNPVEEALAYKTLIEKFEITQEALAEKLGKKRTTITNLLRILVLPEKVLDYIEDGQISLGHAKVLLGFGDEQLSERLADEIVKLGLTVRALENKMKKISKSSKSKKKKDVFLPEGAEKLSNKFGTSVEIKGTHSKGSIVIKYHSKEQLMSLFDELMKR